MEIFKVAFFGHREIPNEREAEERLSRLVRDLLREKDYVEFYLGRNGDFDILCARVIRAARAALGEDNSSMILVLPYHVKDEEFYENYYSEILLPEKLLSMHPKSAIGARNRFMAEEADLVISYICHGGGAARAVRFAEKAGKRVINVATEDDTP